MLAFETKQTCSADEIRKWIIENIGVDCSVQVHPRNTIIVFSKPIKDKDIKKLVEWIKSKMDGKLLISALSKGQESTQISK